MFDDINKLEKEIENFRNNILASSELVAGIEDLSEQNKRQQELIERVANEYQTTVREITERTLESIKLIESESFEATKDFTMETTRETVSQITSKISDTNARFIEVIEESTARVENANKTFVANVSTIQKKLDDSQDELHAKYKGFIERIETINFDNIIQACSDVRKTVNSKTTILLGGMVVIIVLQIVSLFIK